MKRFARSFVCVSVHSTELTDLPVVSIDAGAAAILEVAPGRLSASTA
jgi:hypothetical protein